MEPLKIFTGVAGENLRVAHHHDPPCSLVPALCQLYTPLLPPLPPPMPFLSTHGPFQVTSENN